jgi:prepilin-type processing-associated H-X9-DG protein
MYEGDNDGKTPPDRWVNALGGYYGNPDDFRCPLSKNPISYALNVELVDIDSNLIREPFHTVAFFDAVATDDHIGSQHTIDWRHTDERAVFGFADGHCASRTRAETPDLDVALSE